MRPFKNREIQALIEVIRQNYGIELNPLELRKLAYYNACFAEKALREARERGDGISDIAPFVDALHFFMIDNFGLDDLILGKTYRNAFYINGRRVIADDSGMDLLGTESFKEYCRRNVDLWRQESELI